MGKSSALDVAFEHMPSILWLYLYLYLLPYWATYPLEVNKRLATILRSHSATAGGRSDNRNDRRAAGAGNGSAVPAASSPPIVCSTSHRDELAM